MKKLLVLLAILSTFSAFAQNTTQPPAGLVPFSGFSHGYKLGTTDSTTNYWIYNPLLRRWNRVYTATEANILLNSKIDFKNTLHLFIVAGQSNAQGNSKSVNTVTVDSSWAVKYLNGKVTAAIDPVGNGTGSAWPAFAVEYYNGTHNNIGFVNTAVGGSALTPQADVGTGNWSPSGTLRYHAIDTLAAALTKFKAAGYKNIIIEGILWSQGEADAGAIAENTLTQNGYRDSLLKLHAWFSDQIYKDIPMYISRTGSFGFVPAYPTKDVDWPIRQAEEDAVNRDSTMYMAYRGAITFYGRGLLNTDLTHYKQAGYNEMGREMAWFVLAPRKDNIAKEYRRYGINTRNTQAPLPSILTIGNVALSSNNAVSFADTINTPYALPLNGLLMNPYFNITSGYFNTHRGVWSNPVFNMNGGNLQTNKGIIGVDMNPSLVGTGTVGNMYGGRAFIENSGHTVTYANSFLIDNPSKTNGGTYASNTGLAIKDQTAGTNANYNFYIGGSDFSGSNLPTTGSYSIFNNSTKPNFFKAPLTIGKNSGLAVNNLADTVTTSSNYQQLVTRITSGVGEVGTVTTTGTAIPLRLGASSNSSLAGATVLEINQPSAPFFQASRSSTASGAFWANRFTFTASAGTQSNMGVFSTVNQTGTAGSRGLRVAQYYQSKGSGINRLISAGTATDGDGNGYNELYAVSDSGRIYSGALLPSRPISTDANKNLINSPITGTSSSNVVMSDNPTLTGIVTIPTPPAGENSTKAANMAALIAERGVTGTLSNKTISVAGNNITSSINRVAQFNLTTGNLEASPITNTELNYLSGATSNIQSQLSGKQATISLPSGQIPYSNGTTLIGTPRLTWDASNNRLNLSNTAKIGINNLEDSVTTSSNYQKFVYRITSGVAELGTVTTTGTPVPLRIGASSNTSLVGATILDINQSAAPFFQASRSSTASGSFWANRFTFTASSGIQSNTGFFSTVNQTGTAGSRGLKIAQYYQSKGSGVNRLISAGTATDGDGNGYNELYAVSDSGRIYSAVLLPSRPISTDANKNFISSPITGTAGSNIVMSDSPVLTGLPTTPTPTAGENSLKIANMAALIGERVVTGTLGNKTIPVGSNNITSITNRAAQFNTTTGNLEASTVTNTELGYLSGVTSAIQTQLNAKANVLQSNNETFSGNGSTTVFTLTYDLPSAPQNIVWTPNSAAAAGAYWIDSITSTSASIHFVTAPASGTNNISATITVIQ